MSSAFEKELWHEAQTFLCNPKLKLKELYEWSTTACVPRSGEINVRLPNGIYVCVPKDADKRP